jgi:RHS repeat-associated protein
MTLAEYSPSGADALTWQKSFIYLGGRLLATESGAGTYQYHHPDCLGTRLITNSGGSIISEQAHLPYGTALSGESTNYGSPDNPSKKRFTSYELSEGTKLDHAVNRQYHSGLGRFMQVDPIGMGAASLSDPQTLNLYAYCGNDPINHTDPDGLFFKKLFKAIGKILSNKWVRLAIGIALAILSTGSSAFIIHNFALKVSSLGIGVVQTTTITAAGWAAIGLSAALAVGSAVNAYNGGDDEPINVGDLGSVTITGTAIPVGPIFRALARVLPTIGSWFVRFGKWGWGGIKKAGGWTWGKAKDGGRWVGNKANRGWRRTKRWWNKGTDRPLEPKDLGIEGKLDELKGTVSISGETVTVRIDMIRGEINNPFEIMRNLEDLTRGLGGNVLRIEARIANPTLYRVLERYGIKSIPGAGMDVIVVPVP